MVSVSAPMSELSDGCMENKRKTYQNCSVLYCVPQLVVFYTFYLWLLQVWLSKTVQLIAWKD